MLQRHELLQFLVEFMTTACNTVTSRTRWEALLVLARVTGMNLIATILTLVTVQFD